MAATTSGLTTFSMDVDEIIELALDPLGGEHQSGIATSKARQKLNLILIQMQNKEIPLSKLETIEEALTISTSDLTLDESISDVLECSIKLDDIATPIERKGLREYHQIPNKTMEQRPNLYAVDRLNTSTVVKFWPIPNTSTYSAVMLVAKKIEDITASYQKVDLPTRYLPLLIKWLSYELSLTRPSLPEAVKDRLKQEYLEAMPDSFEADLERVDFTITIGGISGR